METLLDKVKKAVDYYYMLDGGGKVVAGLSGGADSVCLLRVLLMLEAEYGVNISAVHVNHMLRGQESDRDEMFCIDLCGRWNVPLEVKRVDAKAYAEENSLSLEEGAREVRYAVFQSVSSGGRIATAHTASDNAETVIHNLTRGSGLKGLTGIPPVRDNIIRPLIFATRNEVEDFLLKIGQDYVTDSTNLCDDYTRNKIRHQVIPALCQINPSVVNTISSGITALETDNSYIEQQTELAFKECKRETGILCGLNGYHKAIRCRCIIRWLKSVGVPYNSKRVMDIDGILKYGGKINITKGIYAVSDGNRLYIDKNNPQKHNELIELEMGIGENNFSENKKCFAEILQDNISDIEYSQFCNKTLNIYFLDYDKINGKPIFRNRRDGDKIKLAGKNFTSSVKKLFNAHVPLEQRREVCFLADDDGIVMVEGFGISDRVKPDENTHNILKVRILPVDRGV